ncbi:DUF5791 family protein [Halocatena halophila]|uniref:DUF5791 family protein n=1 Tax=Halocatena halophila TaxID=2814576 RepID=UPI002ED4CD93
MLQTLVEEPASMPPETLRDRYVERLAAIVEDVGPAEVTDATAIDAERLEAITNGETEIDLDEAGAIYALTNGAPDGETVVIEARDALLLGMTTAVLDVDTLEGEIDDRIEARAIQQKIEGRAPMTLGEFALLLSTIEAHKR